MIDEKRLEELLDRWEQTQTDGHRPTPEKMCRDCPELLDDFRRRIQMLRRVDGFLQDSPHPGEEIPPSTLTGCGKPGESCRDEELLAADEQEEVGSVLAPPQDPGEIGRLGEYRVLRLLGKGGMGLVFEAEDPRLRRRIALKVMRPRLAASRAARERFLREARAAAAVEHDHIVPIFQVGEDKGVPFIAMPFLKGESLDHRLRRQPVLPVPEVVRIGRETAEGLAAAHAVGLIHRDIKPANLWLECAAGRVKVLDFGLARVPAGDAQLTQEGAILGTPAFMAPEQARGEKVDGRSDLFSLGVILYRLCCGKPAFHGQDPVSTLLAIATAHPRSPRKVNPAVPAELSELVMRLLQKDPRRRPASAAAVVHTLQDLEEKLRREQAAREQTVSLPPSPKGNSAAGRRRRLLLLIGSLVLLAGLVGVALWAAGVIRFSTENGDLVIDTDDPDFAFSVAKGGGVVLEDRKAKRTYRVQTVPRGKDEYELEVLDGDADLTFKTKTFTVKRGEKMALRAWFERKESVTGASPEDAWYKQVASLPAEQQVEVVVAKLKERNPGFDGKVTHTSKQGEVVELVLSGKVKDISPVRALTELNTLLFEDAPLSDLSPLKGMKLRSLTLRGTRVSDLSALKGMPLEYLQLAGTPVSDLSPLKGMKKLVRLECADTKVSDLSPLKDLKLGYLDCLRTPVSDLRPLKGMPLTWLNCEGTRVFDLTPLKGMPLAWLSLRQAPVSDLSPLEGMKLTTLVIDGTRVPDLSQLKGLQLTELNCQNTRVSDLSPLKGMPLTQLFCNGTSVSDLLPLKGMKLERLACTQTKVSDLSPLQGMPLTWLDINDTPVSDLSPLQGMPLRHLFCGRTRVTDLSPLKGLPLKMLGYEVKPERDAEILRSIKTLELINSKLAADFWKEVDAKDTPKVPDRGVDVRQVPSGRK
jgi:serine/threonine protein kinase/Leucine-rich repeat (LRR) protein